MPKMFDSCLTAREHKLVSKFLTTFHSGIFEGMGKTVKGQRKETAQLEQMAKFFRGKIPKMTLTDYEPSHGVLAIPKLMAKLNQSGTAVDKRIYDQLDKRVSELESVVSVLKEELSEADPKTIHRSLSASF
jgi:hypothetical protein